MNDAKTAEDPEFQKNASITNCPHCGVKLSAWEQVLLRVDRVLMCKNCWYRIFLDSSESINSDKNTGEK
jgi:DNA-directed RNA polymerase subunit RPC12/RpoP